MNEQANIYICVEGGSDINIFGNAFERLFDEIFDDQVQVVTGLAYNFKGSMGDFTSRFDIDGLSGKARNEEKSDWYKKKHNKDRKSKDKEARDSLQVKLESELIKSCFKNNPDMSGISADNFTTIIHLIDIDGCFTNDDKVCYIEDGGEEEDILRNINIRDDNYRKHKIEGKEKKDELSGRIGTNKKKYILNKRNKEKNILYRDDFIAAVDANEVIERNDRKRRTIERLLNTEYISSGKNRKIKYYIFYFSSNLDHFIFGPNTFENYAKLLGRELTEEDKENFRGGSANLAVDDKIILCNHVKDKFVNSKAFIEFFVNDDDVSFIDMNAENMDKELERAYYNSWEHIKKNSLKRGTNINVLIEMIRKGDISYWC